jgi:hypothetical protein
MTNDSNQDIIWGPLVTIEMNAGTLDGQSLIDMNNLASGYVFLKEPKMS